MTAALALPAELTHAQARACAQQLRQALERTSSASPMVVDAGALTRFDSSALAVLLECRRAAQARGQALQVRAMPAALASLAGLYGVQELLPAA